MKPIDYEQSILKGILKATLILFGIVVLGYAFFRLKMLLIYIAIALVLTLVGKPILNFFNEKLKISKTFSAILTLFTYLLLVTGIIYIFIPLLISQGKNISEIPLQKIEEKFNIFSAVLSEKMGFQIQLFNSSFLKDFFDFQSFQMLLNSFLNIISDIGIGLFSILFITFFLLKDGQILLRSLLFVVGRRRLSQTKKSINLIENLLSRYFGGLFIQLAINLILLSIVLLIFQVKDAIIIAFLCALLNWIPYIGPLIGGVLIILLTILGFIEADFYATIIPKITGVAIGFIIVQAIDNIFCQPIIFSNSVKSHPLEIFLITMVAGTLFGIFGMIVAIPIYTVIKVLLKSIFSKNKFVILLTKNL